MTKASSRKPKSPRKPAKRPVRALSPAQIPAALKRMAEPSGTARFAAGKSLIATADKSPARLLPHLDKLVSLLASDCRIVQWNALRVVSRLAAVAPDSDDRLPAILDSCLAVIPGPNMIAAATAIQGVAHIAQSKPHLIDRIVPAILQVESATYQTTECRNVAIGHALDSLHSLWPRIHSRPDVLSFVRRQRSNPRPPVARRARAMLPD